ncbi:MAG TPA: hypothetical protein DD412_01595 [Holosporales bacterium]|nr:hypothetical protein [Holosporales bacterium]
MKKILIALTLLLWPLCVSASSKSVLEVGDDSHQKSLVLKIPDVDDVFPERETYYSKEEFLAGFKALIPKDLWDDFANGWSAIYDGHAEALKDNKPARRLSAKEETEHIHCFYNSFVSADPTTRITLRCKQ